MRFTLLSVALIWACAGYAEAIATVTTTASTAADCKSQMGLYYCEACENTPLMCHACVSGYTPKQDGSGCLQCGTNCANCTYNPTKPTDTICVDCDTSYYLLDDKTCTACDDTNCAKCYKNNATATSTGSICEQCKPAHYVKADKCTACDSTCAVCTETSCATCASANYAVSKADATKCSACVSGCKTCVTGDTTDVPVKCTACNMGFYLDSGTCNVCDGVKCKECTKATECITCNTKYFFPANQKTCSACTDNCDECDTTTTCTTCSAGYIAKSANDIACEACGENCKTCSVSEAKSGGTCQSCDVGYTLDTTTRKCMACSTISSCSTCSSTSGTVTCTACNTNYKLDSNQCFLCPTNCSFANCVYNSTHTPATYCINNCDATYAIDATDQCTSCGNCMGCTYNVTVGALSCECPISAETVDTMTANPEQYRGWCSASSWVCKEKYYYDEAGGASGLPGCVACTTTGCKHCNYTNVCIGCEAGYAATPDSNGFCKQCSDVSSQCTACTWTEATSTLTCNACAANYYLDTTCKSCIAGCSSCSVSTPTQCTTCMSNYGKSTTDSVCYVCDSTCTTCTATGTGSAAVTTCTTCPGGTVRDANDNSKCKTCPSHCTACQYASGSTTVLECTSCETYYGLLDKACASCPANCTACAIDSNKDTGVLYCSTCQSHYTKNSLVCGICPFNCETCTTDKGSTSCSKCNSMYFVDSQKTCTRCLTDCLECNDATTCKQCASGKGLPADKKSCPACATLTGVTFCNDCSDYSSGTNATCLGCDSSYALSDDNTTCTILTSFSDKCVDASDRAPNCTTCETGKNAVKVGDKCLISCKLCGSGTYANPITSATTCNANPANPPYSDTQCEFGCAIQLITENSQDKFANRGCATNTSCLVKDECSGNACVKCCDSNNCNDGFYNPNVAAALPATSAALLLAAFTSVYFTQ